MIEDMELPSHVKTWEQTNPKAFELYKKEFYVDRDAKLSTIQGIVEPIARKATHRIYGRYSGKRPGSLRILMIRTRSWHCMMPSMEN